MLESVFRNQEIWFKKIYFIINFRHSQIQVMNTLFPQMIKIMTRHQFTTVLKKSGWSKIPEFLAQHHTVSVISSCKILAHCNKVSVWVEYLTFDGKNVMRTRLCNYITLFMWM